jgi:tetratricopeptide (TPR) repeat protein
MLQTPAAPNRPKPFAWYHWLLILLLVAVAVIGTTRLLQPQMDERYYAHFRCFPRASTSTTEVFEPTIVRADSLFNRKKYAGAAPVYEAMIAQIPDYHRIRLFSALCYMELNENKAAEAHLQYLQQQPLPRSMAPEWYLGLLYLRRHDRVGAKMWLQQVVSPDTNAQAAIRLLQKL